MLGFLIVLLSSVFFCFHNVIVRVLFNQHSVLGWFETGGFVAPTLPNSFLLLVMRMVVVVPMMATFAAALYSPTWKDIGALGRVENRSLLGQSLLGGTLMYLYLALLYVSIGLIPTGIALTLFFTYPVFTALLSWRFFGSRPAPSRWGIMGLIILGSVLTMPHTSATVGNQTMIGVLMGLASGVMYALYTVNAQKTFETMHPVPFTWISFATTLALSAISLLLWHGEYGQVDWTPLWIGGILSAIATCIGHILNNFGIRRIGATSAAMIGASNPALTVVLAWFTIQETLTAVQLTGVLLVTFSVALLAQPRLTKLNS